MRFSSRQVRMVQLMASPNGKLMVRVQRSGDYGCSILVGGLRITLSHACYGDVWHSQYLYTIYLGNVMKPMAKFFNTLSSLIWPVRSVDPTAIRYFEQAAPFYKGHWTGSRSNRWELESLAVHPDCQGHGYGKLLATWGLDQAREEKVSAGVVSAKGKENFYLKCGFDNPGIIGSICEGEGNPLNGRIEGGTILFKDVV